MDRAFFACKAGAGAVDAVYEVAFADEHAKAIGWHSGAITADLSKCYEMVLLGLLYSRAREAQFPHSILRVAISMYSSFRTIRVDGCFSMLVATLQGIIAGCTFATYLLKAFMITMLDSFTLEYPRITLNM